MELDFTFDDSKALLAAACSFQGDSLEARNRCREEFRKIETEAENTVRILVDGLIATLAEKAQKSRSTPSLIRAKVKIALRIAFSSSLNSRSRR